MNLTLIEGYEEFFWILQKHSTVSITKYYKNKLEHHGVRGNVLSLLRTYLSNRFQYTENRELQITSLQLPITIRVPQGSVLGPFLFLVYTNDLPNYCDSKMILYADDSVLLCTDPSVKKLQTKTEPEFRELENWIKLNRLSLNYKKNNTILFSCKKENLWMIILVFILKKDLLKLKILSNT